MAAPKKKRKRRVERINQPENQEEVKDRVDRVVSARNKPSVFAKRLSELLTSRAGHPVKAVYIKGAEKEILRGTMPWVRTLRTDSTDSFAVVIVGFSDSALTKKSTTRRMVIGMTNNLNNRDGVRAS